MAAVEGARLAFPQRQEAQAAVEEGLTITSTMGRLALPTKDTMVARLRPLRKCPQAQAQAAAVRALSVKIARRATSMAVRATAARGCRRP